MEAIEVLRGQLAHVHNMLEFAIDGLTEAQLHHTFPDATIQAAGPIYVHVVASEDFLVTSKLRGQSPIYVTDGWAEKIGIDLGDGGLSTEWATAVKIADLELLREYARAVYAATDAHMASLSAADLDETIEFMGEMKIGDYLGRIVVWHAAAHGAEIAAIKGMLGLQGLPF